MINMSKLKGKVPILNHSDNQNTPYLLVDFPTKEVFHSLYSGYVPKENQEKYWDILNRRKDGATLEESGRPHAVSRERVRQIEAKFIRLVGQWYWSETGKALSELSQSSSVLESL